MCSPSNGHALCAGAIVPNQHISWLPGVVIGESIVAGKREKLLQRFAFCLAQITEAADPGWRYVSAGGQFRDARTHGCSMGGTRLRCSSESGGRSV